MGPGGVVEIVWGEGGEGEVLEVRVGFAGVAGVSCLGGN